MNYCMDFKVGVKCSNLYFREENLDISVGKRLQREETRLATRVQVRREMTKT